MTLWKKYGVVFCPDGSSPWMVSHAACPFPVHLEGDVWRVYFATRNRSNHSQIATVDVEFAATPVIVDIGSKPLLSPGKAGTFDDCGVYMPQIIEHGRQRYMYYMGWHAGQGVPFDNRIGLAVAPAGSEAFVKYSPEPILNCNDDDPFFLANPWVLREGDEWRMWYASNRSWYHNGMDIELVLKLAHSHDGIRWQRPNITCIDLLDNESGIVRPCVIKDPDGYKMWYSRRIGNNETSRMGFARSDDGIRWQRRDSEAGLDVSPNADDWDGEMVAYPCVFDHKGQRMMLYNGNGYGRSGFGLAMLE